MISAVVLTHNNEGTIRKTLESLHWADESIIVDDASTDKTVRIAQDVHAQVFERKLDNDFSSQRNFGLEKAKHEWVLFVDSDEVVSKELAAEITNQIRGDKTKNGFYIKRIDIFWNKLLRYGETGNMYLLRLAKKDAGCWINPVHEMWQIQGETGVLKQPLMHNAHPTVFQFLDHINTYSSMYANFLYRNQKKESGLRILVNPIGKFLVNYIWKLGILDGTEGAIYAIMMSFHSFLVRAKLWHLWQKR